VLAAERFKERLSASAPNVRRRDQEPQDKGRDQDSVCPADNDATGVRLTTESDERPVKQEQAQARKSGRPNQRPWSRCRGFVAHEAIAHQREHHRRAEDDG